MKTTKAFSYLIILMASLTCSQVAFAQLYKCDGVYTFNTQSFRNSGVPTCPNGELAIPAPPPQQVQAPPQQVQAPIDPATQALIQSPPVDTNITSQPQINTLQNQGNFPTQDPNLPTMQSDPQQLGQPTSFQLNNTGLPAGFAPSTQDSLPLPPVDPVNNNLMHLNNTQMNNPFPTNNSLNQPATTTGGTPGCDDNGWCGNTQLPNDQACAGAVQQAQATCNGMGPAAMAAKAAQQSAGQAGQTIVINNAQNSVQPDPHAACLNQMAQGGTAAAGSAMVAMACKSSANNCLSACGVSNGLNNNLENNGYSTCKGLNSTADMMMGVGMLAGLGGAVAGIFCGNATAATPVPDTGIGTPPGDAPWQAPDGNTPNGGGGGNGANGSGCPPQGCFPASGDGSGVNAGLPSGAGAGNGGGGGPSASPGAGPQKDYDLGLSNGGGTGSVGFGGGGGGWPTAKNGTDPKDLLALLNPKAERTPAGQSEISGANDLTNFQKVTRMMNKKRPVLKAAE